MAFDESKHPRDSDGKFTDGSDGSKSNKTVAAIRKYSSDPTRDLEYSHLPSAKRIADSIPKKVWESMQREVSNGETVVKVNLDSDIQREFDRATPKERQKIAFDYIMRHLRGKYPMGDGRIVAIERVGADKMTHSFDERKIRVLPELKALIEIGHLRGVIDVEHRLFSQMAYYDIQFQINDDVYKARLNVGIRNNGNSTLYDIKPIEEAKK